MEEYPMDPLARRCLCLALLLLWAGATATAAAAPDLVVQIFDPPSGTVGRTFEIPNAVRNIGTTGSGGGFTAAFVLSSDTAFTPGDTVIGERSFDGLAPDTTSQLRSTTVTIPASVPGGTYYLAMAVDTELAVAESNELNNLLADPDPVTIPALAPDIGGHYFFAEPGAAARQFAVEGGVQNYGTAPAGAFAVGFYLSADTAITTADTLLGTDDCGALAPGAEGYVDGYLTVPLTVPAGTYYLGMLLDTGNAVAESNEANNAMYDPDRVVVSDLPDLVPSHFAPPEGPVLRTFEVPAAVTNYGATAAGPFSTGFYLSTDTTITTADTLLGTRAFAGLPALGAAPVENTTVTVPLSVLAGSYYLGMVADPGDAVAEADEANNVAFDSGQVTIPAAVAPDIGTTYFFVQGTALFKQYDFRGEARNFGTAPTGPFSVAYYLSVDRNITLADTLLGVTNVVDLAPGAAADLHRFYGVPAWVPAGPYYLGAILDPANAVAEANETNNTAVDPDPGVISSLPDLALSTFRLPDGVAARTFVIGSAFRNDGMTAAGPFGVEFYLSADQAITGGDILLGTRSHGGLTAGATGALENTTATIPPSVPGGPYYLGVIIDPANAVAEAIEANNVLRIMDPVTVPPAVIPVPPSTLSPTDTEPDGKYDDVNGNGRKDFADVVLFFNQVAWIAANEPIAAFDCNGNGRIDFADVVWIFTHL
jgi:subtilase family serine protease